MTNNNRVYEVPNIGICVFALLLRISVYAFLRVSGRDVCGEVCSSSDHAGYSDRALTERGGVCESLAGGGTNAGRWLSGGCAVWQPSWARFTVYFLGSFRGVKPAPQGCKDARSGSAPVDRSRKVS
jgi:hypothetical protein